MITQMKQKAAITTFFDYFYDDARYTDWVADGRFPAGYTRAGGRSIVAAADP